MRVQGGRHLGAGRGESEEFTAILATTTHPLRRAGLKPDALRGCRSCVAVDRVSLQMLLSSRRSPGRRPSQSPGRRGYPDRRRVAPGIGRGAVYDMAGRTSCQQKSPGCRTKSSRCSSTETGKFRDRFGATGCKESFGMPFQIGVYQRMLPYLPLPDAGVSSSEKPPQKQWGPFEFGLAHCGERNVIVAGNCKFRETPGPAGSEDSHHYRRRGARQPDTRCIPCSRRRQALDR